MLILILFAIAAVGVLALLLIFSGRKKTSPKVVAAPIAFVPETSETPKKEPNLSSLGFGVLDTLLTEPPTHEEDFNFEVPEDVPKNVPNNIHYPVGSKPNSNQDIIVLYLLAPEGRDFAGYELLQALLAADLRYGEMSIFHRYERTEQEGRILFSLASALEPGIFDMADIGGFSCPGLTLFMTVSQTEDPVSTFELMLETAEQLAVDLDGMLCDETRQPLTDARVASYHSLIEGL